MLEGRRSVIAIFALAAGIACGSSHNIDPAGVAGAPGGAAIGKTGTGGGSPALGTGGSGVAKSGTGSGTGAPIGGAMMNIPGTPTPATPCTAVGQCGGAVPSCGASQRCQGCRANADCAGFGGFVCDAASGTCVECATAMDCQSGRTCSAAHTCERGCATNADCTRGGNTLCVGGLCVECMSNADCGGQKCDASGSCVDCLAAADCTPGTMCLGGDCVTTGCTSDTQCAGGGGGGGGSGGGGQGQVCAQSIGVCVECLTNAQCGDQGYCQPDHTCA